MKVTTTNFFKHKTYLFSVLVLLVLGLFCTLPAYSQIDYSYGINKKGFRLGIGVGTSKLQTYWGDESLNPTGLVSLDYNVNQYFSLGIEGQFGKLVGVDNQKHYAFLQSANTYYGGNFNMKFGIGLLSDFSSPSGFTDALKQFYFGLGFGALNSSIILTDRTDGLIVPSDGEVVLKTSSQYSKTRTGTFYVVPISFGTNIDLRGLWGNDKVELNPNFQYNFGVNIGDSNAKVFDGYQPNANTARGGYALVSVALKYKF
jgi:hypothetical protein